MNYGAHLTAAYVRNNIQMMRAVFDAVALAAPLSKAAKAEYDEGRATVSKMIDADAADEQDEPAPDHSTWPLDRDPPAFLPAIPTTIGDNAL